ncbi:hypothetical protein C8Q74DRAFT_1369742 [Fomes fomentarius]|nr:hypothetical protein C8Q74DRAFT_1369742 [Fomes fomentarius]
MSLGLFGNTINATVFETNPQRTILSQSPLHQTSLPHLLYTSSTQYHSPTTSIRIMQTNSSISTPTNQVVNGRPTTQTSSGTPSRPTSQTGGIRAIAATSAPVFF